MEPEYIISYDQRSDCCDAPILGEIVDGIGICGECHEPCAIWEDEDVEEADQED